MAVSSSGTRLTNEFRYLLDMIIFLLWWAGWFRAAAIRAGWRGRGQGSAARPTAQRLGLDAGTGRRILSVAGPPVRGGERAVFLGPVVPDRVHPDDLPVAGELHRVGHDRTPARCGHARRSRPDSWCRRTTRTRRSRPPGSPSVPSVALPRADGCPAAASTRLLPVSGLRRWTCSATSTSRWKIRTRCSAATASTGSPASTIGTRYRNPAKRDQTRAGPPSAAPRAAGPLAAAGTTTGGTARRSWAG